MFPSEEEGGGGEKKKEERIKVLKITHEQQDRPSVTSTTLGRSSRSNWSQTEPLTHSQQVLLQKQVGSSHALIHTASSPCRTAASHAADSRACGQLLVFPELNSRPVTGQMNLFLAQWMWVTTPLG